MLNLMDASREEVAEADRQYRAGIVDALARFAARWADAGHDALHGSVESLLAVGEYFLSEIRSPTVHAPPAWLPAWWDPQAPLATGAPTEERPLTRDQLMLIDEVHAYYAEVVMSHAPAAHWAIYKGSKKEWRNGKTVLYLTRSRNGYPLSLVHGAAIRTVLLGEVVETSQLFDYATKSIATANAA